MNEGHRALINHTYPASLGANLEERLSRAEAYGKPRQVWVDDGHVFVEGHDGKIVSMTPEVAIELGRVIGNAGSESLVNKVLDDGAPDMPIA